MNPRSRRPDEDEEFEDNGDELGYGSVSPRLVAYRLRQVERRQKDLEDKFDDLIKTLVGSVITIAILMFIYLATQGSTPG